MYIKYIFFFFEEIQFFLVKCVKMQHKCRIFTRRLTLYLRCHSMLFICGFSFFMGCQSTQGQSSVPYRVSHPSGTECSWIPIQCPALICKNQSEGIVKIFHTQNVPLNELRRGVKKGAEKGDRKRGGARLRVKGTRTHRSRLQKTIYHLALLLNPSTWLN